MSEIEILKEKCTLLDFRSAISDEITEHTRALMKTHTEIEKCNGSILDIDENLKKLNALTSTK
jgi:hypothetical protein